MSDTDDPGFEAEFLATARDALAALRSGLHEASIELDELVHGVTQDWTDERGRAWVERAQVAQHELGRQVDLSGDLARMIERLADERAEESGAQLGGTDGARVRDERGVRIAILPERGTAR